jgi:hypothetical protein
MPYEEFYNPADDIDSHLDELRTKNKLAGEIKRNDSLYEKYTFNKVTVQNKEKFVERVKIEQYGSGQIGSKIRNAVTGQRYPFLVGSVEEDLFFRVVDSNGRQGRQHPLFLFYDSPEQFENHRFTKLDKYIKERWYKQNLDARKRLE